MKLPKPVFKKYTMTPEQLVPGREYRDAHSMSVLTYLGSDRLNDCAIRYIFLDSQGFYISYLESGIEHISRCRNQCPLSVLLEALYNHHVIYQTRLRSR